MTVSGGVVVDRFARRRVVALALAVVSVLAVATGCSSDKKSWNVNAWPDIVVSRQGGNEPVVQFARGGHPPKTLVVKDAVLGKGPVVKPDSTLYVAYLGVLTSTAQTLYSSWRIGHGVTINMAKTPKAWQEGLVGMKAGGTWILIAPPSLLGAAPGSIQEKQGPVVYVISLVSVS